MTYEKNTTQTYSHIQLKKERSQINCTKQGEKNNYTSLNEILNKINEKSSLKQQTNHTNSLEETRYSREIRNQSDIDTGTAILLFNLKKKTLLNLHRRMNIQSDHTIY